MEKQHNRGQDGAGLANIKFDTKPGEQYINITKSNSSIADLVVEVVQFSQNYNLNIILFRIRFLLNSIGLYSVKT